MDKYGASLSPFIQKLEEVENIVQNERYARFDVAIDVLENLYREGHKDKNFLKFLTNLKLKYLLHMLKFCRLSNKDLIHENIDVYFNEHTHRGENEKLFRRFLICLLRYNTSRQQFYRNEYEREFGHYFMSEMKKMCTHIIKTLKADIEKSRPRVQHTPSPGINAMFAKETKRKTQIKSPCLNHQSLSQKFKKPQTRKRIRNDNHVHENLTETAACTEKPACSKESTFSTEKKMPNERDHKVILPVKFYGLSYKCKGIEKFDLDHDEESQVQSEKKFGLKRKSGCVNINFPITSKKRINLNEIIIVSTDSEGSDSEDNMESNVEISEPNLRLRMYSKVESCKSDDKLDSDVDISDSDDKLESDNKSSDPDFQPDSEPEISDTESSYTVGEDDLDDTVYVTPQDSTIDFLSGNHMDCENNSDNIDKNVLYLDDTLNLTSARGDNNNNEEEYTAKGGNYYLHDNKGGNKIIDDRKGGNKRRHSIRGGNNEKECSVKGGNDYLHATKGDNIEINDEKGDNSSLDYEKDKASGTSSNSDYHNNTLRNLEDSLSNDGMELEGGLYFDLPWEDDVIDEVIEPSYHDSDSEQDVFDTNVQFSDCRRINSVPDLSVFINRSSYN